jgi:catalase
VIRERELQVLANVDAELCAAVAAGLGLPAPAPTVPLADSEPSPALSQLGGTWPTLGRTIGIVADASSDLDGVRAAKAAITAGGMVPLVIAPTGGMLGTGDDALPVQRTFLTARSVELDAVLLAGAPAPAADAAAGRDAKAGDPAQVGSDVVDPRVTLLLSEAYRHAKAIGAWGAADVALAAAGCDGSAPGVVVGEGPDQVLAEVVSLLAEHRVWHRFPPASA